MRNLAPVLLLLVSMTAGVRAEGLEVSGGFSMLRETQDQVTFPAGWIVGAAHPIGAWLSVLGEIDGQRKAIPSIGSEIVLSSHAFTIGARAATRIGRVTEFAQLCAGLFRADGDAFGSRSTSMSFAVQPGLGIEYPAQRTWAFRTEVDVRWIRTGQQVRGVASVVYRRR